MIRSLALIAAAALTWPAAPPPAPVHPVTDTLANGQKTVDPYRWMESRTAPEVQRYFKQQADYTNAVLARLGPGREKLRARITQLDRSGAKVADLTRVGNRLFYIERPVGANNGRLMVREADGSTHLLFDPDAFGAQQHEKRHITIEAFTPSDDGARVAMQLTYGGAELDSHVRIVETASGTLLSDDLTKANPDVFSADGTTLYYLQFQTVAPGHEVEAELNAQIKAHVIGSSAADPVVFGAGHDANVTIAPTDFPAIVRTPGSPWAFGVINHGVAPELTVYAAPQTALAAGGTVPWRKIVDVADAVTSFDVRGDTIYLVSHANAPTFKVTALDLRASGAAATTLVPAGADVIDQIAVAADALYVRGRRDGLAELRKLPWSAAGTGPIATVALPYSGTLSSFTTDARVAGAAFLFQSWTKPSLAYALDANGTIADTGIRKAPAIDVTPYVSREVKAPSADGTLVPVSIVMRRDAKLDGARPAYLTAYGAYGISIDPYFLGASLAWLDAGGVYVVAHARGGGELGEGWHQAGRKATKQHTIDDVVAAARWLIANHYTSPKHLAIEGTSAGGITVGGAITQHPELFAAAIDGVGVTDALRTANDQNGAVNFPEFGDPSKPDDAASLYAMDAYLHVHDGVAYPALIGITGINDPRVPPWQVAKFTARVRAATTSGRPVLMRVDYDAGHGFLAASASQAIALLTDEFSFLLWQCGSPLFAGIPTRIGR